MEKKLGADVAGFLVIDLAGYKVRKGILLQAKLAREADLAGAPLLDATTLRDLETQCSKMLSTSPSSFVLVQHRGGMDVAPALSFTAGGNQASWGFPGKLPLKEYVYTKPLAELFRELVRSFAGDHRLGREVTTLEDMRKFLLDSATRDGFVLRIEKGEPGETQKLPVETMTESLVGSALGKVYGPAREKRFQVRQRQRQEVHVRWR